jgi:hypothetical protein
MLIDRTHRRWIAASGVALVAATAVYVPYHRGAVNGPSGGSALGLAFGIAGFALMLFAGLLGARRQVPTWRVGRGTTWMRGHIWLGLLSLPLILFHGGFRLGGPLTLAGMVLLGVVIASGVAGLILQQMLPRMMMTRLPLETVYEQIDAVVLQLRDEADRLVATAGGPLPAETAALAEATRGGGGLDSRRGAPRPAVRPQPTVAAVAESPVLRETYVRDIRPFLDPAPGRHPLLDTPTLATGLFRTLRTALPPVLHDTVDELETVCDERRQLAVQKRLHHWLHGWLLVHIPLSLALLLLGAAHAVVALRY